MRKWGQGTIRRKGLIVYVRMVQTNLKYVSRCRDQRSGSEIWCQRFFNIFGNEVSTRAQRFELIMTWVWNSWGLGDSRESHVEAACLVWDTWIEGSLWPEHGFSDLLGDIYNKIDYYQLNNRHFKRKMAEKYRNCHIFSATYFLLKAKAFFFQISGKIFTPLSLYLLPNSYLYSSLCFIDHSSSCNDCSNGNNFARKILL